MEQISLLDYWKPTFKIDKPIRLIELFAGIGFQAKALKRHNANFEHYKVCEFDDAAIKSYNALHGTNFIKSDITRISAKDLEIIDTDKYCYIMTYSFPCQDLSLAGNQKGMSKDSGTRSGLLWEVERLLNECDELPQVLLMENVPQVHSEANKQDFYNWVMLLESKGYTNYLKDLNAKNYGIPQNRNRAFMVSILGDYKYEFPKEMPLELRLKDMLEDEVDEKYYLNQNQLTYALDLNDVQVGTKWEGSTKNGSINREAKDILKAEPYANVINPLKDKTPYGWHFEQNVYDDNGITRAVKAGGGSGNIPKVVEPQINVIGNYSPSNHDASRIVCSNGLAPTVKENHGTVTATQQGLKIRKLTPKECWRLMGFDDADFEKASKVNSNSQLYKQAGNSIVVDVLYYIFGMML